LKRKKIEIKVTQRTNSPIMQVQCQAISQFQAIKEAEIQKTTVKFDEKVQGFPQEGESHDYL